MESITSRRSLSGFYATMAIRVLFFTVMGVLILSLRGQAIYKSGEVMMSLVGLGFLSMAGYTIIRFYKNALLINVNTESINIDNAQSYHWKNLKQIKFTGKQPFRFFLFGEQKECLQLEFEDQKDWIFFDDMYSNAPEIKLFIKNAVINKAPLHSIYDAEQRLSPSSVEHVITYKGFQLLSFEGIFSWIFTGGFIFSLVKALFMDENIKMSIIMMIPLIFILAVGAKRMYYFELSDSFLIIKNQQLFWKRKTYLINDILEIVFEQRYRRPVTLRVITNTFESKAYPATTTWSKKWLQLKKDLENKNIRVRNECVFYEPFKFKLFDN